MPIYPYRCPVCQQYKEVFKHMSEIDTPERCEECGELMIREISAPPTRPFKAFFNEWLTSEQHPEGVMVNSWGDQKKYMKEANVEYAGTKPGKPGCWV